MGSNKTNTGSLAIMAQPFVSGGLAAMFASTCIHPIDLIKVRLQVLYQIDI